MGVELVEGRGYEPYEARRYKKPTLLGQLLYHCLREVIEEFMANKTQNDDSIEISPNMNLGLKSPFEAE